MTIAVKRYTSTMTGAPTLNGTAGSLITLLDACLKDGFNTNAPTGATQTGGVATLSFGAAHGYAVNDVIALSGANESVWNDEFRVLTAAANSLTFAIASDATTPATGTLSSKTAPLGWTKPYSGTNKAAYLPPAPYVPCYVRVQDDSSTPTSANGRWAKLRGYETMSDVDTGTGPFPTVAQSTNGLSVHKSSTSDSTARAWWLVGDGGIFYLGVFWSALYPTEADGYVFGDINSLKSGDGYSSLIAAHPSDTLPSYPGSNYGFATLDNAAGRYLARAYTQLGSAVTVTWLGDHGISTTLGYAGLTYPHPVDNGLLFAPVGVKESAGLRSRALPGLYQPLHVRPLAPLATVTDIPDLPARTLLAVSADTYGGYSGQALFDITGPWR